MEDKFHGDNLLFYIEKEIIESFDSYLILDDFLPLRGHVKKKNTWTILFL
jgi:hypothetical protein